MPPKNNTTNDNTNSDDQASELVRKQLDAIYSGNTAQDHQRHQEEQIKRYHEQWQDYYQKYYERYYVGQMHRALQEQERSSLTPAEAGKQDRDEDVKVLREKIVSSARDKAKKARRSKHFVPIISAVLVASTVAFLQYNQMIISRVQAYVSPGAINPNNIVVDPTTSTTVSSEPRLIIPKINVDVPVVYGAGIDQQSQLKAMEKGVAHFPFPGADSVPGQKGNTVISGHSSNDLFDPGDYKFIFAQLEKMKKGDTIYVNYESTRYTYTIVDMKVVTPQDVQALLGYDDKPYLTLITCTPLGTALNRLLIYAEQVAPDPDKAKEHKPQDTETPSAPQNDSAMPGIGPTALEWLFGAR